VIRPKLNQQIVTAINEKTKNDHVKRKFIIEVLFEEIKHQEHWHFRGYYKNKIREYNKKRYK